MILQSHSWAIYPEKTIIWKDTCTPGFIAALFTIAKTRKQPKCPSTEEWIKKMGYIYTIENYSAIKKEWNDTICSNMSGPRDYHIKWIVRQRMTNIWYHLYAESKKMIQMNLFSKEKQTHRLRKQTYGYQRGKLWEEE